MDELPDWYSMRKEEQLLLPHIGVLTLCSSPHTHTHTNTEDRYFRFLVEQTLAFDLLLYVAWFLLVAVIYVVPGTGDYVTNILNFWFFGDPRNCCFGPYKQDHHCTSCPPAVFGTVSDPSQCVPCQGFFSFDAHIGVNLTFIVPAASMQAVNLLYAGLKACWQRSRYVLHPPHTQAGVCC